MWVYSQSTGQLWDGSGKLISVGYSGYEEGKNNPRLDEVVSLGPIPRGEWVIGEPYDSKRVGPFSLLVYPHFHVAHKRTYFRIHGDSSKNPGKASRGCMIFKRSVREKIHNSLDRLLRVIE